MFRKFLENNLVIYELVAPIMDLPHKIKRGLDRIKRFIDYAPLIWEDEDWDYHYLITLMHFKLNRMQKEISESGRLLHAEKYAKQIRVAMRHMEKAFIEDKISEEYSDDLSRWWNLRERIELPDGYVQMHWDEESEEYKKLSKVLDRHRKRYEENYKYHFNEFVRLFRRNLEKWWD